VFYVFFGQVVGLKYLDLDLCFSVWFCMTRASLVGLPASSESTDGRHVFNHRLHISAWSVRAKKFVSLSGA